MKFIPSYATYDLSVRIETLCKKTQNHFETFYKRFNNIILDIFKQLDILQVRYIYICLYVIIICCNQTTLFHPLPPSPTAPTIYLSHLSVNSYRISKRDRSIICVQLFYFILFCFPLHSSNTKHNLTFANTSRMFPARHRDYRDPFHVRLTLICRRRKE